jgi:hypothetical protein
MQFGAGGAGSEQVPEVGRHPLALETVLENHAQIGPATLCWTDDGAVLLLTCEFVTVSAEQDSSGPKHVLPSEAVGESGNSFLGRFSKGLSISSMKEKTKAALDMSSMKETTKAISGKMNSLMSAATKDDKKAEDSHLQYPAMGGAATSYAPAPKRTPGQLRCM